MSIFPFITPNTEQATSQPLPLFQEYAYDFENNCLLQRNGTTYLVEGNEALKIWTYHALLTQRFRYIAHSAAYGCEAEMLIGRAMNSITLSELRRFIIEALMVNPYIVELSNFTCSQTRSGVTVEFDCTTIYGPMLITHDWKGLAPNV